ncbi:MAG: STAS/SEC14 domain-containing protein [Rhodocyclaceae bacterium]|nr:STAS/SEC14 domain-containing protein [Rhodocyclaceae bacterium]MDZ4214708.1 STAS/SEC14 domain-containing protein [Rhodocyclaceae bacterium]
MITVEHQSGRVSLTVFGEFTLEDFTEFEEFLLAKNLFEARPDLLVDLREMAGFTVDMAVEEIKFSRLHGGDFRRIAVVTDSQWVAWSAWLETLFADADLRVFTERDEARGWLAEAS